MFSKSQQTQKLEQPISEKLNSIFSQCLQISLYLQSTISIKGVPSTPTFNTKSTLLTHAQDTSYK